MNTASDFLISLEDIEKGGFRFSSGRRATLIATAYSVLGLEFSGTLANWPAEKRSRISRFILSGLAANGFFHDPLFREEDILSREHDLRYFEEETSSFCLQALDALDAEILPLNIPEEFKDPQKLVFYLKSLPWKNPWLDSNRVMFALSRLCYEAEKNGKKELLHAVDQVLDWLDTRQNQKTGLWHGQYNAEISHAMAAAVHFAFFYSYRLRRIHCTERIIDSCLSLQSAQGLFGGVVVGHTCFDYDAVHLLSLMKRTCDYRKNDVKKAMSRAASAIRTLQNSDGGFADAKVRVRKFFGKALPLFLSKKIDRDHYNNCWKELACGSSESNAYSTWFRSMTLALAEDAPISRYQFRRLPFLGYLPR